jgi:hypothetical protein
MTDLMVKDGNTFEQIGAATDDMKGNVDRSLQGTSENTLHV